MENGAWNIDRCAERTENIDRYAVRSEKRELRLMS